MYIAKLPEAYARVVWCKKHFGDQIYQIRWRRYKGKLYFRNKDDFLMYKLVWD